jgi:hypothetical protein
MLEALEIEYFQDVLSLPPGQRWERELYRNIDVSNIFMLFWSKAARRSEWVEKEVRYALMRKGGVDENPPEIVPIILENESPPSYMPEYHFRDPFVFFIMAAEIMTRRDDVETHESPSS